VVTSRRGGSMMQRDRGRSWHSPKKCAADLGHNLHKKASAEFQIKQQKEDGKKWNLADLA
jgi:hypothetical protein